MSGADIPERVVRKLEELRSRCAQVTEEMSRPEVASDTGRMTRLVREHGQLRRMVEPYEAYLAVTGQLAGSRALLDDRSLDAELRAMAAAEVQDLQARAAALLEQMQRALVTEDDAAVSAVILEIRAGTGGEEAALFARDLFGMYTRYAEHQGFEVELLDRSESDLGGFKEVILGIRGPGVYQHLGYEGGGHRVQRVPQTESQGRIHTSAATVAVLPECEEAQVQIDWEKDVVEHVSRAGGPGGQNVNKVSSAIRLEHLPTGITVSMRDEKSQHKNRARARRVLASRVAEHVRQQQASLRDASRRRMIGSGDRSERIRTYNFPQNRCTDHRIGVDWYNLDRIIAGELGELVAALQAHDIRQRLAAL